MEEQQQSYKKKPKPKQKKPYTLTIDVNGKNDPFDEHKTSLLTSLSITDEDDPDKSRAGHIDGRILSLVNTINEKQDLYTTSSCSGRIIVFYKPYTSKYQVEWLYLEHDMPFVGEATVEAISKFIESYEGEPGKMWFKLEPPIVSIRARNVSAAAYCVLLFVDVRRLLNIGKAGGLKNGGVRSVNKKDGTVMVTLVDTHRIEALVAIDRKVVVSNAYIDMLIAEANEKLAISHDRFDRLIQRIDDAFP